jgi:hypothetical protein
VPFVAGLQTSQHSISLQGQIMPHTKTGKPALAGLKPLPKAKGFDPAVLKATKGPQGLKLVPKRGMIPGKSGQR